MQRMGWKYGQALGKNNDGETMPIAIDIKVGRGGLYSCEEQPPQQLNRFSGKMFPKKRAAVNVDGECPCLLIFFFFTFLYESI